MSTEPFAGGKMMQVVTSQDHWYVNFTSQAEAEHNNHLVVGWAVMDDAITVVPLITSPSNQRDVVPANTISTDYVILNPYNQCPACVRPVDPLAKVQQDLQAQATHSIPEGYA